MKKKLLIIRFSSIGDIVLTTPLLRCLKKQKGDAIEIHYLTKDKFSSILKANPFIDKIIVLKDKLRYIIPELKQHNYDHIIDLHNNLRSTLVKLAIRKPAHSFQKLNLQKWILVNFKINYMPDVHIVDRYMQTIDFLDIKYDGKGLDYFYNKIEEVKSVDIPEELRSGYIVFVIGGKHFTKKMPNEKIISVLKKINYPVFILGGKEDKGEGEKIASVFDRNVYNGCGKYSINQSASIVRQAKVVVTHDTGLMHIAAAFQKPVISIWGNTVPDFGMYPFFPLNTPIEKSKIIEVKNLSCRPCSKIGYSKCPKKHFKCMKQLNENEIAESVKAQINGLNYE